MIPHHFGAALGDRKRNPTGGAFDATVEPLLELWGIGPHPAPKKEPEPAAIAAALARIGWRHLEVRAEPPALRKARPDLAVDFSSVAKGLVADAMGKCLTRLGLPNHLVGVGGDLRAAGQGLDGSGWPVGIDDPQFTVARISGVEPDLGVEHDPAAIR